LEILNKSMKKVKITPRLLVAAVVAVIAVMNRILKRNKWGRMIRRMKIIIIKEVLDGNIKGIN